MPIHCRSVPLHLSVACPLTLLWLPATRDDAQPVVRARRLPGSGLRHRLVRPEEPGEGGAMGQAASGPSAAASAKRRVGGLRLLSAAPPSGEAPSADAPHATFQPHSLPLTTYVSSAAA